jgi:hypothetical protein
VTRAGSDGSTQSSLSSLRRRARRTTLEMANGGEIGRTMIDERARFELHRRLVETLGEDHAVTLMSHLPPAGWADLATREDIRRLEDRIDRLEERFEQRLDERTRLFIGTTIAAVFTSVLATAGVVLAATGGV